MQIWNNHFSALLKNFCSIRSGRSVKCGLLLFILALIFGGCSRSPKVLHPGKGNALALGEFKRYEKHMERDFFHHCRRKVYTKAKKGKLPYGELQMMPGTGELLPSDRGQLLEDLGSPTLMRRSFKSREGEKIEEWAYRDSLLVFQFIDGRLVYEGPLSDLEALLIIHGYPNSYLRTQIPPDGEMQVFTYRRLFTASESTYNLVNDTLSFKQEGG